MPVRRADVVAALSVHDPAVLRQILEAADIRLRGAESADELADRIADALWWNYSTPIGYVAAQATLEDITDHVARRLRVEVHATDPWERVRSLAVEIARTTASKIETHDAKGVAVDDLDASVQAKLHPSWMPTAFAATGGASALAAGAAGKLIVRLGATPVGRLLPLLPTVGPIWGTVRKVGGVAATVGTPLAVGLSVVALHQAFGTNYWRLVPLLLGVGALGPTAVSDAQEVPA